MKGIFSKLESGFTLIELLVVITVIGILASVVLIAINPLEQFARTRDAARKSIITQLGRAAQGYYTAKNATYPAQDASWINALIINGDIKNSPTNPSASGYAPVCSTGSTATNPIDTNKICYRTTGTEIVIYVSVESALEKGKCAVGQYAWIVYSSADGRAGTYCTATSTTEPAPGALGSLLL